MRLACCAARDAVDGRCAALALTGGGPRALASFCTLAPRLRSLASLELHVGESEWRQPRLMRFVCGADGLGAALAALPNPALLTSLTWTGVDVDALGAKRKRARQLEAALAHLSGLRRLALHWGFQADERSDDYDDASDQAAAAFGALRRLGALEDLTIEINLEICSEEADEFVLYAYPPLGADVLPWRALERVALLNDGAALLPLFLQPEVAPQLGRLRSLHVRTNEDWKAEALTGALAALFQAPWLSQLTSLRLEGLEMRDSCRRKIFEALPAPDAPRTLLPAIQELHVCWSSRCDDAPDGLRRLLGACRLGALRDLRLQGFSNARSGLAGRAAELTALTALALGDEWSPWREDTWRFVAGEEGGGSSGGGSGAGGSGSRAVQLAAFLAPRG